VVKTSLQVEGTSKKKSGFSFSVPFKSKVDRHV
jgi:hypothetical protein